MVDEARTRACAECGWPALAGTRRCPYCRQPFPAVRNTRRRRGDPIRWLVIVWAAAMAPVILLALSTLGAPLALGVCALSIAPGAFVWLLRRRSATRIERFGGRGQASRPTAWRRTKIDRAGSGNPSSDARR